MASAGSRQPGVRSSGTAKRGQKTGAGPSVGDILGTLKSPIRRKMMWLFDEYEATRSPVGLSRELDVDLSKASYHVRVLKEMGLIRLVRTEQVRGSLQHFYASTVVGDELVKRILIEFDDQ